MKRWTPYCLVTYDVTLKCQSKTRWYHFINARNGKSKSKLVTTESFGHLSKNRSSGEFLKSLKSEKINKSLCVLQQMKG
jgi:hypothetical protein